MAQLGRALLTIALILVVVGLMVFVLVEPFLNLPDVWQQASVGLVLVSFIAWSTVGAAVVNRRVWPKRWRLKRTPPARLQVVDRLLATTWGNEASKTDGE
ncbi:MAG: hypothetical protein U0559_06015 [Anaerolineae bacterium]